MTGAITWFRLALLTGGCGLIYSAEDIVTYTDAGVTVERRGSEGLHRRVKREIDRDMSGFNHQQKIAMLRKHNALRSAQSAADMMYMEWDDRLADSAQKWAEQCDFTHSDGRYDLDSYQFVGENMYGDAHSIDPASVVQFWYDEKEYYDYKTRGCTHVCGHYMQVVWASSRAVGCGVKYCPVLRGYDETKRGYNVVCHYGPGGNYAGERPYYAGKPCSKCPLWAPYCIKGLCAIRPKIGSNAGEISQRSPLALVVSLVTAAILFISFR